MLAEAFLLDMVAGMPLLLPKERHDVPLPRLPTGPLTLSRG